MMSNIKVLIEELERHKNKVLVGTVGSLDNTFNGTIYINTSNGKVEFHIQLPDDLKIIKRKENE